MILALLLALCRPAAAEEPAATPQMTSPIMPATVHELHDQFIEATEDARRVKLVERLARTAPMETRDVQSLFDLFMRFPETAVRDAVLSSLERTGFDSPDLDLLLVHYLDQPEPEARIFAIKAAVHVRDARALSIIEKLAEQKFAFKSAEDASLLSEKNGWWVQYEALAALAQWKGEGAMPLLLKKSAQAPETARIMGRYLWKASLPQMLKWAAGSSRVDQDRAQAGLSAPAPTPELRETRDAMLAVLRDRSAPKEARHQLALKIGVCSTHTEMADLYKEYESLKSEDDRLMYRAALFASRDKIAVPLLIETMKGDPKAANRSGALAQLEDMLPPKEVKPLLEWAVANDPDPQNRDLADHDLKALLAK